MKQIVLLIVSLFFVVGMQPSGAAGSVNVSIGVSLPPLVFPAPPDVVVVPSGPSYVYMVPGTPGLYFYNDVWYRFYGDRWYRSNIYDGPWGYVEPSFVPRVIVNVPPDYYRYLPRGYHRIHYGDFRRDWRKWGHQKHWNRYDWYKQEMRHGRRSYPADHRDRHYGGDRHRGGSDQYHGGGDQHRGGGDQHRGGGDQKQKKGKKAKSDEGRGRNRDDRDR